MASGNKRSLPNLYLVGFMGVGKSAIGRRLAKALGFRFLDSDREIERRAGMTIPEIFEQQGEAAFRKMELEFIEGGHPECSTVVSCGGGLVVQPGMDKLIKSKGEVFCLFASLETILERTGRNTNRPLLNVDDPAKRIRELLAEREPIYRRVGTCISTEGRSIQEVARHVARSYRVRIRERTIAGPLNPRARQPRPKRSGP